VSGRSIEAPLAIEMDETSSRRGGPGAIAIAQSSSHLARIAARAGWTWVGLDVDLTILAKLAFALGRARGVAA
jgi:hypothetical protein